VQVLHVTGPKNLGESQVADGPLSGVSGTGRSSAVPYVALPYVDRMDLAYAAADFALCRAGAMTCAELTAVGLPAAYVPLPIGNGEQRLNALPIAARGGGLFVEDAELTADWIKNTLLPVLTNIDQVAGMSEAAAAMGRKDADRWLAKAVIEIAAAEQVNKAATTRAAGVGEPGAGSAVSPLPQPPAPASNQTAEQPGSLFTPRTTRRPPGGRTQAPVTRAQQPGGQSAPGGRHRHAR
jgi:UDP-N-acetylglucosamine--N-acetylmuramyl-(pentapeptide) pyrophosphoryl-undecaprenol N-acetylglucosamine transferase